MYENRSVNYRYRCLLPSFEFGESCRLDALGSIALALMYVLLAWRTTAGAVAVQAAGETTMIISLPMWWVYAALAPGLALSALLAGQQALALWRQPLAGEAA